MLSKVIIPVAGLGTRVLPASVTKLGQKPFRQLVSLLHVLWLMVRLRPNSVSSGSTDRQLDCTPQSPQPSHTASLMSTRTAGSPTSTRIFRSEAQCLVLHVQFVDGGKEHTDSGHAVHETLARLPLVRKRLQALQALLFPHAEGFELRVPVPQQLSQWQASPLG